MANDYGIKVVGAGKDITTTDPRDLIMSSQYSMLKFHSDNSGSVVFTPGDSHQYIDFTHNLGYVPAFISYYEIGGTIFNINSEKATGVGRTYYAYSWANTGTVRCGIVYDGLPYGVDQYPGIAGWQYYDTFSDWYDSNGFVLTGNYDGGNRAGCFRIPSLTIAKNETIVSATFSYQMDSRSSTIDKDIALRFLGIDEDDTADFNGSNPMTRSVTSAYEDLSTNIKNNSELNFGAGAKSVIQEITTRSGWTSGNAIAFRIQHNGSDADVWGCDTGDTPDSYLRVSHGTTSPRYFRTIIFKDKIA